MLNHSGLCAVRHTAKPIHTVSHPLLLFLPRSTACSTCASRTLIPPHTACTTPCTPSRSSRRLPWCDEIGRESEGDVPLTLRLFTRMVCVCARPFCFVPAAINQVERISEPCAHEMTACIAPPLDIPPRLPIPPHSSRPCSEASWAKSVSTRRSRSVRASTWPSCSPSTRRRRRGARRCCDTRSRCAAQYVG